MTYETWDEDETEAGLVPLYVLVNGRTTPRNTELDLATQVIALPAANASRLEPVYRAVVNLCGTWISIAEIGAHLHRPLTLTKVVVDVLLEQRMLDIGIPAQQMGADRDLLEAVLAGLERL
jgi:hypothetical protein